MENEKKEVQIEDSCYKFEEMRDSMLQSLMNLEKVLKQQKRLIEMVTTCIQDETDEEKQPFEEFIKETESQNERLEEQKAILSERIGFLNAVLERCKDNAANAELVSLLAEALGMFKQ